MFCMICCNRRATTKTDQFGNKAGTTAAATLIETLNSHIFGRLTILFRNAHTLTHSCQLLRKNRSCSGFELFGVQFYIFFAAILDSGDQITKPTSRMVLQPLIIHKKSGIQRLSSPSRLKVILPKSRYDGCHLGFWKLLKVNFITTKLISLSKPYRSHFHHKSLKYSTFPGLDFGN